MVDDRAARAPTDHHDEVLLAIEDEGRAIELRGRLPGSTRFGNRLPFSSGAKEIGKLVVEEEAVDHLARAESILDRSRHRQRVAVIVDDRECSSRDSGVSPMTVIPRGPSSAAYRPAHVHRLVGIDEAGATLR